MSRYEDFMASTDRLELNSVDDGPAEDLAATDPMDVLRNGYNARRSALAVQAMDPADRLYQEIKFRKRSLRQAEDALNVFARLNLAPSDTIATAVDRVRSLIGS